MNTRTKSILILCGLKNQVAMIEHGFCPICSEPVSNGDFKNKGAEKAYKTTGLCQNCQTVCYLLEKEN